MKKQDILIICGGTASGKTFLQKELINTGDFYKVITATSRPKRENEKEGIDYYFYNKEDFKNDIEKNKFLEYEIFSNNYYGTPKKSFEDNNKTPIAILEPKGAKNLKKLLEKEGYNPITIFVDCNEKERIRRAKIRDGKDQKELEKRLKNIINERDWKDYLNYDLICDGEQPINMLTKRITQYLKKKPQYKLRHS